MDSKKYSFKLLYVSGLSFILFGATKLTRLLLSMMKNDPISASFLLSGVVFFILWIVYSNIFASTKKPSKNG